MLWCESINFGAEKSPGSPHGEPTHKKELEGSELDGGLHREGGRMGSYGWGGVEWEFKAPFFCYRGEGF